MDIRSWDRRRVKNAVLIAASVLVIALATSNLRNEKVRKLHARLRNIPEKVPSLKSIALTPDLARKILSLSEADQKALILPPATQAQADEQRYILYRELLSEGAGPPAEERGGLGRTINPDIAGHEEEEAPTENQVRAEWTWGIIFVTVLATASVFFETFRELLEEGVPKDLLVVVEKFFAELATLGFIGTVTFLFIHYGVLGQLSLYFTGTNELLIEEFELLHYLVFTIMCIFISYVLVLILNAIKQGETWAAYESDLLAATADARHGAGAAAGAARTATDAKADMDAAARRLMRVPAAQKGGLELQRELGRTREEARAEFLLFRARFIEEPDSEVTIPEDFNFARYMSRCAAADLSSLLQISVTDWIVIWWSFALFCAVAIGADLIGSEAASLRADGRRSLLEIVLSILFALTALGIMVAAFFCQRALLRAKARITPVLPPPADAPPAGYGAIEAGGAAAAAEGHLVAPPRYLAETRAVCDDSGTLFGQALKLLGKYRRPNRHEQLFAPYGAMGPQAYLFMMRHSVLLSTVVLAAGFTMLNSLLTEMFSLLPYVILLLAVGTFALLPTTVNAYTWCCSVEQLKRRDIMIEVLREQKHEKLLRIIKSLTWLSFFVDQVEALSKLAAAGDQASDRRQVTESQWKDLLKRSDPKEVEELEALFDSFDADKSGELDEDEVKELVSNYLGTHMSDEEAAQLFRVMDADGSGAVDFREFATVILHLKAGKAGGKAHAPLSALADKIFRLFDRAGTGIVTEEQVVEAVQRMGKNWDISAVRFLFSQMDRDGSGEVSRAEFADFLHRVEENASA